MARYHTDSFASRNNENLLQIARPLGVSVDMILNTHVSTLSEVLRSLNKVLVIKKLTSNIDSNQDTIAQNKSSNNELLNLLANSNLRKLHLFLVLYAKEHTNIPPNILKSPILSLLQYLKKEKIDIEKIIQEHYLEFKK